jgi:hypothetical protein
MAEAMDTAALSLPVGEALDAVGPVPVPAAVRVPVAVADRRRARAIAGIELVGLLALSCLGAGLVVVAVMAIAVAQLAGR